MKAGPLDDKTAELTVDLRAGPLAAWLAVWLAELTVVRKVVGMVAH